ncbi:unnamed protein product [Caenorhabditis auriculariae]|uniref:Uncharacterized protein n=1 Tax=Caenorhabditis auriculariae TaxID=2777116 RepID=A0A8S1H1F8_9PELO|nr:unnamed protein product [Caenorhabditis auriculariae]
MNAQLRMITIFLLSAIILVFAAPYSEEYDENLLKDSQPHLLLNLLKRPARFHPMENHDQLIKAILKSRRY